MPDITASGFKCVVCSATIDKAKFSEFLAPAPNQHHATELELTGSTFPVHIEHRDDVEPDVEEVGHVGAGKVLCSYATHTALSLLESTEDGNVLVFMPGQANIDRCAWCTMHGC